MKIISIVGARPQFIKLAPLHSLSDKLENIIIHTGQHFDENMSTIFFDQMNLPKPKYNLDISGGAHGKQTGRMLIGLEEIMIDEKPDLVIVFGDTNSTLAGSLSASKLGIPLLHIESGLRSFNKSMPEEINRILSDHCSDFLFAPTKKAIENLQIEGLGEKAFLTGDIMVDSVNLFLSEARRKSKIIEGLDLTDQDYYLLTLHRPYNVDDPEKISLILSMLSNIDKRIVFPVHPRTKQIINKYNIKINENILLLDPLGYFDFLVLQDNSHKILTDSGGIQKEAYILQKPCITIRPETEWVETVDAGWNKLINPNLKNYKELASIISSFTPPDNQEYIFGQNVSYNMKEIIIKILNDEK
ncbi:MAG: UDP-N-acetylglucosamine 2-epimerase (non-hydrolyzing) [Chloroflexi bacterium]|nr:UDP-N-acetylglucosamine 2-epimerase (non-hydrolyzing) [Chloroflexota bacterium]|tara:strand:- start:88 stop:1161 length:1074 start_codon:yes stop_codon:yes gene_type:complete